MGLGQFGRHLAVTLSRAGVPVTAVDLDAQRVEDVKDHVARAVRADITDERALRAARVNTAECAIVALGETDFEPAVLGVVNLVTLEVPRIVARSFNAVRGQVLQRVGATSLIFPEVDAAEQLAHNLLSPGVQAALALPSGYTLAQIVLPATMVGLTLKQCEVRHRLRVNVIAVKRSRTTNGHREEETLDAGPDLALQAGDVLIVAGRTQAVDALASEAL